MEVHTLLERGGAKQNEDQLLITDNLYGAFDGATSLDKYVDTSGNTGGFLASLTAKEVFAEGEGDLLHRAKDALFILMANTNYLALFMTTILKLSSYGSSTHKSVKKTSVTRWQM